MRFVVEALRHILMPTGSFSFRALFASGGAALAVTIVILGAAFGAVFGTDETPTDTVAVTAPVFTPVAVTAPAPEPAYKPAGSSSAQYQDAISVTRAVQRELKRAGCYSGPINGVWSSSTRAAMGEFTARVNARLPVDRADPVLLALLETHNKISCTGDCSMGAAEGCTQRASLPREKSDVASAERSKRDDTREEAHASSSPTSGSAEDLGYDDQRRPNPIGDLQTASVNPAEPSVDETSALPPAAVPAPKAASPEHRKASRKYKQPSFAREVSKGLKSLQRSINKLF
jgi:hypothetical protein